MFGQLRRGSPADAPLGTVAAVRELFRGTAHDSPLTLHDPEFSATYETVWTPSARAGEPAPDFELPRLGADHVLTGDTVRLSAYRDVCPVALVFGSYT
jgi:hypothetical protein